MNFFVGTASPSHASLRLPTFSSLPLSGMLKHLSRESFTQNSLRWLFSGGELIVLLVSALALLGWFADWSVLYQPTAYLPAVTPSTAVLLMLLSIAAFVSRFREQVTVASYVSDAFSVTAVMVSFLILASYFVTSGEVPLNALLRITGLDALAPIYSSPQTAVATLTLGLAIFFMNTRVRQMITVAQWMAFVLSVTLIVIFLSYAFELPIFFRVDSNIGISLVTANACAVLSWSIVTSGSSGRFSDLLARQTVGGELARTITLMTAGFPVLLAWIPVIVQGDHLLHLEIIVVLCLFIALFVLARFYSLAQQIDAANDNQHKAEVGALAMQSQLTHLSRVNAMGELAAGIAHEFNQPLNAIQERIKTLRTLHAAVRTATAAQDDEFDAITQHMTDQIWRMSSTVQAMEKLIREESLDKRAVPLQPLIEELLVLFQAETKLNYLRITTSFINDLPDVMVDPVQIQQVLLNLLQNAKDSMQHLSKERRWIDIQVSLNGMGMVQVDVSDCGKGIPKAHLKTLFEPLVSTQSTQMFGFGLSLCRAIVEKHDGHIWVRSEEGRWTTFSFTLLSA